jgi:osmotically-inducible protein OsmY
VSEDLAPEYVAEHVRQAITTDPRTTEQGIDVRVLHDEVFLAGEVSSEARRDAVGEVAAEVADGHRIHNDVRVIPDTHHHGTERIT